MNQESKKWLKGFCIFTGILLVILIGTVVFVDPFMHYHKPLTNLFYYQLDNQRSQNDGIEKHFDYDALITGTSMTENFKTSEMDAIFGTNAIKVSYSGASFKEINDSLERAILNNQDLKIILRCLDGEKLLEDKNFERTDLGTFPKYLYDFDIFNDVKYIFNKDLFFDRVVPMIYSSAAEGKTGITKFDDYSNWMDYCSFGVNALGETAYCPVPNEVAPVHLSDYERQVIVQTVDKNITSLAEKYPDITFYLFFAPYSISFWNQRMADGTVYKQFEAEEIYINQILKCKNIKLYSFNADPSIVADLNNYKDILHYASWINSELLLKMHDDVGLLTEDNYEEYLEREHDFILNYDYDSIPNQIDYEDDYYAEYLLNLNERIFGKKPVDILSVAENVSINNASYVDNQINGQKGIDCKGTLPVEAGSVDIASYLYSDNYIGAKIVIDDISDYRFLTFYGKKCAMHGMPVVEFYDEYGNELKQYFKNYAYLSEEYEQHYINIDNLKGKVTIIFHGGYVDSTGSPDSEFIFSDIKLY